MAHLLDTVIAHGWSCFPCALYSKQPMRGLAWSEYQHRQPTPQELDAWKGRYARCNVAVIAGSVSGIIVLDQDGMEGALELQRHPPLPPTPTARTSKGKHFYFQHPGEELRTIIRLLPGLDLIGDGNYVMAPGSVHRSGTFYIWEHDPAHIPIAALPDWLISAARAYHQRHCIAPTSPRNEHPPPSSPTPRARAYAEAAMRSECTRLRSASPGTRNNELNRSAFRLGKFVGREFLTEEHVRGALLDVWASWGYPDRLHPMREALATIASGIRGGIREAQRSITSHADDREHAGYDSTQRRNSGSRTNGSRTNNGGQHY